LEGSPKEDIEEDGSSRAFYEVASGRTKTCQATNMDWDGRSVCEGWKRPAGLQGSQDRDDG